MIAPPLPGADTFFGYYAAALRDYWYHGGGSNCKANSSSPPPHNSYITDLSNSSGTNVLPAADAVNGTYDSALFTAEAVRIINEHAARARANKGTDAKTSGLYIYLAYQCAAFF